MHESGIGQGVRIEETTIRVGKVVAFHRASYSVDIAPDDGPILEKVPLLLGAAGSTFGVFTPVSPSYDKDVPGQATYPEPIHDVRDPDTVSASGEHRDIYAVYAQIGGSANGIAGHVALGIKAGPVMEGLFTDKEYEDQWLVRHPSDVQITINKRGKVSVQHPSGARITIGKRDELEEVVLTGQDFDHLYRLRENLGQEVGIRVRDSFGDVINMDARGNVTVYCRKDATVYAKGNINARAKKSLKVKSDGQASVVCDKAVVAAKGKTVVASEDNLTLAAGYGIQGGMLAARGAKKVTVVAANGLEADLLKCNVLIFSTIQSGSVNIDKSAVDPEEPPDVDVASIDGVE